MFRPGQVITDVHTPDVLTVMLEEEGEIVGRLWYSYRDPDWVYTDCTIGRFWTGIPHVDEAAWREITPELLQRLSETWELVLNLAHAYLASNLAEENRLLRALERGEQRGGRGIGTDFYKGVALEYRRLIQQGFRPTTTIARRHGVSRSTASRWVRRARELGFLGAAMPRRAGETVHEEQPDEGAR